VVDANARALAAESRLSAIRQRAESPEAEELARDSWERALSAHEHGPAAFLLGLAAYRAHILGDGAAEVCTEPSTVEGAHKLGSNSEPTTAEAFATLEKGMQEWGRALENDPVERKAHAASRAALSLLERRMGAMARALQRLEMFLTGPTRHDLPSLDEVRTALTDAPAVFTLDEVEEAVGHVLEDWQNEWTVDEGKRRVRELLTAFRE
jgi:hypothetical protein